MAVVHHRRSHHGWQRQVADFVWDHRGEIGEYIGDGYNSIADYVQTSYSKKRKASHRETESRTESQAMETEGDIYHGSRTIYRKRKFSKRAKARVHKKMRHAHQVQRDIMDAAGNMQFNFSYYANVSATGLTNTTQQCWSSICFFGNNDCAYGNNQDTTDVSYFRSQVQGVIGATSSARNVKFFIKSYSYDLSVNNSISTPIEIDVYYLTCRQPVDTSDTLDSDAFAENILSAQHDQQYTNSALSQEYNQTINSDGVTPWQVNAFLKMFIITKVTSLVIPGNGSIKMEGGGNINKYYDGATLDEGGSTVPYLTRYILFRGRGFPSVTGPDYWNTQCAFHVKVQKRYVIKAAPANQASEMTFGKD